MAFQFVNMFNQTKSGAVNSTAFGFLNDLLCILNPVQEADRIDIVCIVP